MKKLVLPACILGLLLSTATAADPREASEIVKEYNDVKAPTLDPTKIKDADYVRTYLQERAQAQEKQNRLALELYQTHPDHPQATAMMLTRWGNMLSGRDTSKSLAEMDQFLKDHPDSKEKGEVLYWRAIAIANSPLGDTFRATDAAEEFIKANPRDERGGDLLSMLAMRSPDKDARLRLQKRIIADYPSSRAAKMAAGSIRQAEGVGKPFELAFSDAISGRPVSIKGLKGKVVVIDFWATWCGPCVGEMPKMKELYAKYKDQGVEFIGVSLDQPGDGLEKLKTFVEEEKLGWPQYYMGNGWESEFSQSWGINGIPSVFIVDADGNLHSTEARGRLDQLIPDLIKKRDGKAEL
jgi:thiol-disulfide isomerase/thioredoxin